MIRLLRALLGLGQAGVNLYMIARARFFAATAFLFLLILFEWMLNYWGFIALNIIITFALFIITIVLWTRPEIIILMEAMEAARVARKAGGATVKPRVPDENYFLFCLAYVLLWTSIVSMFVTTLPFGWYLSFSEAFVVTFVGLMFISVIAWTAFFKWTSVVYYKRIIMTYAICGLLICVWMIIPGSIKYWATGIEFYGTAGTSETARAMTKAQRKIEVKVDKDKARQIKEIGNKLAENGGNEDSLTFEERAIWHEAQRELKNESLSEKLSQIELPSFGKKNSEYVPPAQALTPAPAPAPEPIAQIATEAPAEEKQAPAIPSEATIYWGKNFEHQFRVKIVKFDDELEFEKITYGTGTWHGAKNNRGLYSGIWTEPTARGLFEDIRLSPDRNILATGKIIVLEEELPLPLEVRR